MKCPLCRLVRLDEIHTELAYQDDTVTVTYCKNCRVPMAVLNRHGKTPNEKQMLHIDKIMKQFFPDRIDRGYMKTLKNHYHAHWIKDGDEKYRSREA